MFDVERKMCDVERYVMCMYEGDPDNSEGGYITVRRG